MQNVISYHLANTKKGCTEKWTCTKSGLKCSLLRFHCSGNSYENTVKVFVDDYEEFSAPVATDSTDEDYNEAVQGQRNKLQSRE